MSTTFDQGELSYRRANKNDLPKIINLLTQIRGDKQNVSADQFLIACSNNLILGCVRIKKLDGDTYELSSLGVLPEWRNKNIGSNLVKRILIDNNQRPIYLLCFKQKEEFYRQFSFEVIKYPMLPASIKSEYERVSNSFSSLSTNIIAMMLQ